MDLKTMITILVPLFVAVLAAVAAYLYNLRLAQRKDRLERTDRQLKELYGPLFALVSVSTITWKGFVAVYRQRGYFPPRPEGGVAPETDDEKLIWRRWMNEVFMPLNTRMAEVVLAHTDLLEDEIMPDCLLILSAHVHGYRGVTKGWEEGDFSQHNSLIAFPRDPLLEYAESHYVRLKAQQSASLGLEGERRLTSQSTGPLARIRSPRPVTASVSPTKENSDASS